MDVVNYIPLGAPLIDGKPIGYYGDRDESIPSVFNYKPAQNEIDYCHINIFFDSLPDGRLWEAFGVKGTKNYALGQAIGEMIAIIIAYFEYLRAELNIDTTEDLIQEWEESVGLPDACTLQQFQTLDQRRALVKIHLLKSPYVTCAEIEEAIKYLTGYDIKVRPRRDGSSTFEGSYDSPSYFDIAQFTSDKLNRFTVDVFINYTDVLYFDGSHFFDENFPFDGEARPRIIECVLNKLKPSNCIAIYHYDSNLYRLTT